MSRAALGFNDSDSGSEEETSQNSLLSSRQLQLKQKQEQRKLINKQISAQQQRNTQQITNDDEKIYEYDEVYESIQQSRNDKLKKLGGASNNDNNKGSKYIDSLLEAKRKREEDKLRVQELKIQKEREAEGDTYKEKEEFVTTGYKEYKEKMNKIDKEEEERDEKSGLRINYNDNVTDNKTKKDQTKSRESETRKALEQIEQLSQNSANEKKINLLPKLSNDFIEEAKKRYFERNPSMIEI